MSSVNVITDDESGASLVVGIPVPVGAGEANTLVDAGQNVHETLVADPSKVNEALQLRGLRAGDGITITENATDEVLEIANSAGAAPGDVLGPAGATANAPAAYDGATGKLLKDADAPWDMRGQNVANVGTVDGRDVAADGTAQDTHIADTGNPHATTAALVGADPVGSAAAVQANLTAHVGDLANPHATTAAQAGADPAGTAAAAVASHESTFDHSNLPTSAEKAALAGTGTPSGLNPYVSDDDARLSDSRAPSGPAGGDLAGTYPNPTVPHILLTTNPHSVTAGQVGAIPAAEKGAANGVAELDAGTTVPVAQLPDRAKSRVFKPANAAARLALSALEGDEAEQQDDGSQWLYDGTAWIQRAIAGGDVAGPASSGDNEIVAFDGTTGKVVQRPNAPLSANGQNIVSVGTVDGRSVSVDGAKLDGIEAGAKDDQVITAGAGLTGGGTGDVALAADFGSGINKVTEGNDSRLLTQAENDAAQGTDGSPSNTNRYVTNSDPRNTDARAPLAHGSTHQNGGGDEVGQAAAAANAIPKATGGGTLAAGWIDDTSHGDLGGGSLHADAIPSVSGIGGADGFLTRLDKEKLDGVAANAKANQDVVAGTGLTGGGSGDTVNIAADVGTGVGQVAAGNDARFPTAGEKAALVGTGTPGAGNPYVSDDDSRLTDARAPTGAAGGQLSGTYPNPNVSGLRETFGPTNLAMGAVADGEILTRSGTSIVGSTVVTTDEKVKAAPGDTTPADLNAKIVVTDPLTKAVLNPTTNAQLDLKVKTGTGAGDAAAGNDARFPTASQKDALAGTSGTPSSTNRYVTNDDPRNTDARTPAAHAASHQNGGTDEVATAIAAPNAIPKAGAGGELDGAWLPFGTAPNTVTEGDDSRLPTNGEKAALSGTSGIPGAGNKFVTDGDPRNSDSRIPTGTASGQLGGTYPGPEVRGLRETGGPTLLNIGSISDGQVLRRQGGVIDGVTPTITDELVGVSSNDLVPGYLLDKLVGGAGITLTELNDAGDEDLRIDAQFGVMAGTITEGNDTRIPTQDENDALAGTNGLPSASNRYVTNTDPRNTNTRDPNLHDFAGAEHAPSTLALVNSKITDATLIDTGDPRLPTQDENNALQGTSGVPSNTNRYVTDADARNSDARAPTGPAGGDLTGTYPNPGVVQSSETIAGKIELATQAEVDAGADGVRAVTPATLENKPKVGLIQTAAAVATADVSTTATIGTPATLLSIALTPVDAGHEFIVHLTASGEQAGTSDEQGSVQFWYGLTGSEALNRATYIFHDNSPNESGSCALTVKVPALGAGEHTFQFRWGISGSTFIIDAATQPALHHASLLVQEVNV